ncbi:MAG: TIR domain-containing protein, partial [Rhodanobacteraceae bacterium]
MSESSGQAFTYRAFISYSHRDKAWADWLHKALETYRVPSRLVGKATAAGTIPRRLNPIFRDREELASAAELGRKVNEALGQSENLIVLCSPAAATSRWVNEEVLAYKRIGRGGRIFCLIVGGEPNATDLPGRESEECFCPALRFATDADGQPTNERTEPIAADARPGKDGKPNAKLKLIAGMLDVGFDALKQREQQRRIRRMTAITALAVCVMAVTIVLAIFALVSRHRAVIAQHEAVVAQQAAQRRQKQAEGLVAFMLGDLNDKLQEVNRLDIMQSVDDKAMAYFQSLPNKDVNVTELVQRAKALEKIGSVRMQQGELPGALAAYRASVGISSRLATESPDDVARQIALSRTLTFIGYVYWDQGKLENAGRAFQQGRQVLQASGHRATNNPALLYQLYTLDDNIGHVLEARGRLVAARNDYRDGLAVMQSLVRLKPHSGEDMSELGSAHNNLGRVALERGDLADAIEQYKVDNAIETRLTTREPKNHDQLENTLKARAMLGRTLALTGDSRSGIHDLQQAVGMARKLAAFSTHDTDYEEDESWYGAQLGRLYRLNGDLSGAKKSTAQSIAVFVPMLKKDPSNAHWQSEYAYALTERAAELRASNQIDAARKQVQIALRILDPILAKHPTERRTLRLTMTARELLAEVCGDPHTAYSLREAALKTLEAQSVGKDDPRLLALQVGALLSLGRKAQAQPLIKQLWNGGYRDAALVQVLQRAQINYPPN